MILTLIGLFFLFLGIAGPTLGFGLKIGNLINLTGIDWITGILLVIVGVLLINGDSKGRKAR